MSRWTQRSGIAAYPLYRWQVYDLRRQTTLASATEAAESLGAAYCLYCHQPFTTPSPVELALQPGDALVFKGPPARRACVECDTYVLERAPRNMVFESDMLQTPGLTGPDNYLTRDDFADIGAGFSHFFTSFCHVNWRIQASLRNETALEQVYVLKYVPTSGPPDPDDASEPIPPGGTFVFEKIYPSKTLRFWRYPKNNPAAREALSLDQPGIIQQVAPVFNRVFDRAVPIFDSIFSNHFEACRQLQWGERPCMVFLSIGGWLSSTWDCIMAPSLGANDDDARTAAKLIATFIRQQGFDGVDLNFEGPADYVNAYIHTYAQLAARLRVELPDRLLTITPMNGYAERHLKAIQEAAQTLGMNWTDVVSWINCQFYSYNNDEARPLSVEEVNAGFGRCAELAVAGRAVTPARIGVGFPLEGRGASNPGEFNREETVRRAIPVLTRLRENYPNLAGAFVWRYQFVKIPRDLNWAGQINAVLGVSPPSPPRPSPPQNLRIVTSTPRSAPPRG